MRPRSTIARVPSPSPSPPPSSSRRQGLFWKFLLALIGVRRATPRSRSTRGDATCSSFAGDALDQLGGLNRKINRFCAELARVAGSFKQLPVVASHIHDVLPRPPLQFPGAEDYIFFVFLHLTIHIIYERIFAPFHPTISPTEDRELRDDYIRRMAIDRQTVVGQWRSRTFHQIESHQARLTRRFIDEVTQSIITKAVEVLDTMPGDGTLWTDADQAGLRSVVQDAYEWNSLVKGTVTDYDLIPFIPQHSTAWDPVRMVPFARLSRPVTNDSFVISVVAFGLQARRIRLGLPSVCEVQEKSSVLVPEWFT